MFFLDEMEYDNSSIFSVKFYKNKKNIHVQSHSEIFLISIKSFKSQVSYHCDECNMLRTRLVWTGIQLHLSIETKNLK